VEDLMIFISKSLLGWLVIQVCLTLVFIWYLKSHQPKVLANEQLPKTAVILCLRGADPFLPTVIRSLLRQDYPQYDLKIIIDSPEDPAYTIVKEAIAQIQVTNVQISTLRAVRHNCSLKCNALIQAVSDLDESYKAIALIDGDTIVHPTWLRELVSPLIDSQVGVTTGNRWYVSNGNYWGSLVRFSGNVSTVVQMFLFGIPWGGSLAMKTEVLHRIELLDKWEQTLCDDLFIPKLLKLHGLKVQFVPSLLMVNREECDLPRCLENLKRLIISARFYHPAWLAIVSETISSILFPSILMLLIIESLLQAELYVMSLLFFAYSFYTIGVLLLMLLMEVSIQPIIQAQGQHPTPISLKHSVRLLVAIPLTQWMYGLAMLSSIFTSKVTWRGINYRLQSAMEITLVEYHTYQWLDQPIDPKISL
jgi:cellulose synthase/poly-beta-1,6-N-acetylglucosamine synthase-like glycosyltransferase